jgi:membrane-bound serine protease (ClpP class)
MLELASLLWSVLTNPFVAFLLLAAGVWALVFAVSIPGTGIPEAGAVICLALAFIGLTQLQVNYSGLLLIALAILLFVLEFRTMAHGALLVAGMVSFAIGAVLLFRVAEGAEALLSWGSVLVVTGLSTAGFAFLVWRGLAVQRLPVSQDPNRVIGHTGVARTDVPAGGEGSVYVDGELWSARADDKIPAGSPVVVVKRDGLWLKVTKST